MMIGFYYGYGLKITLGVDLGVMLGGCSHFLNVVKYSPLETKYSAAYLFSREELS
jgi:hypothetical protein